MWTPLKVDPTTLTEARLLVHWACQPVAAAGAKLVPARADDSHTNLAWDPESGALVGHDLDSSGTRVALRPVDLTLLVLRGHDPTAEIKLAGSTLRAALAELETRLRSALRRDVIALELLGHELPHHPVREGAPFDPSKQGEALAELEHWLANAREVLEGFVAGNEQASPVRLWPHHFDMASLITLDAHSDPEQARSVNVGLSFGDGSYPEPYVYVSPWPYPPNRAEAPALDQGRWHNEGFFAAVLTGSEILTAQPEKQGDRVESFIRQAYDHSRALLETPTPS